MIEASPASFHFGWTISGVFVCEALAVWAFQLHMSGRGWQGYGWARKCSFFNNVFYALFSLLLVCAYVLSCVAASLSDDRESGSLLRFLLNFGDAQRTHAVVSALRWVYVCSKLWEFQDLVWLQLGGLRPSAQILFHHLTTFPLSASSLLYGSRGEFYLITSNLVAHALIYLYFSGFRGPKMTRCMFVMAAVQLIVGIVFPLVSQFAGQLFVSQPHPRIMDLISMFIYSTYAVLWSSDVLARRRSHQAKTK